MPTFISPPSMIREDVQSREADSGSDLDFPISTNAPADESHSVNNERQSCTSLSTPSMSFFQGSSNVKIGNSNFNEIHGNATIIRFGDGQFTEVQRNLICDYIANLAVLPDIRENLNRTNLIQAIRDLPHAEVVFDDYQTKKKSGPCFEGTRVGLLREMADWITGLDESKMYVLSGLAGIGKSTVAYTIASRAANLNLLGASFFFSRDESDRRNAKKFFTTTAYQLCLYNKTFAKAIGDVLQTDGGTAAITKGPQEQLQALIVDPLHSIVQSRARPILLVVDALDECDEEDALSVLNGLKQLVRALQSFKVILTARPQPRIDRFFDNQGDHKIFHLQDIENKVVDGDIRLYINHGLSLEKVQARLPMSLWCASDKEIDALVRAAGRLFIIASTVVQIILDNVASNPAAQMQRLLGTFAQDRMPFKDLNEFYTVILRNVVPAGCDDNIVNRYQSVVGAIIFIQHPLPISTLAHLINIDVKEIRAVLVNLRSVILVGDDDTPRIYHKSFPDYITDLKLCQDINLRIDLMMRHMQITICCFQIMDKYLKRNILGLGDPARFMSNEDGLQADGITNEQLQERIPQHLRYACAYWVNHLEVTNIEDEALMTGLERFANEHMLYWLTMLLASTSSDLHQLLSDVLCFISKFYEIIKRSAFHTYHPALLFTPMDTLLYRRYIKEAERNICSIEGGPEKWDALVANLGHEGNVQAIKFSLDSSLLASCSVNYYEREEGKLQIWDATTGTPISTIPGHSFAISNDFSTVASSQDNVATLYNMNGSPSGTSFTTSSKIHKLALSFESSRVAAGLSDGSVCLWNSMNAELVASFDGFQSLEDRSWLQFSSTGTRLTYLSASGIILRDGTNGRFIADLPWGSSHKLKLKLKFGFSGDGSRIANMSFNDNLTMWNSENGELITAVKSVSWCSAISTNGSLLATTNRSTVTLWNENLAQIKVLNVRLAQWMAFSSNNILVIIDSIDVKFYNVNTHSFIHTLRIGLLLSDVVAFSPDLSRLAAVGRNVHLWDIRGVDASDPPLEGNVLITALTLSRDCSRVACGFRDGTVKLWETNPTMRQITPLALRSKMKNKFLRIFRQFHHTNFVMTLGFYPDGRLFASGSYDHTIKLWNGGDGALRGTLKLPGLLKAVALSNSLLIAAWSGRQGGVLTLWSLDTLRPIHTFQVDYEPFAVSIAENSTLIAVYLHHSHVTLFDVVDHTIIRTFDITCNIYTMTFLPDNSQLVVQSYEGLFQSFHLIDNHIMEGPTLEHLVQLPNISLWRPGVPVWQCEEEEQHYFAALYSQHKNPVPVLWIPEQIRVSTWIVAQGSSMIALGCEDGRIILLRLPASHPVS